METRPAALAASKVLTEKRPSLTGKGSEVEFSYPETRPDISHSPLASCLLEGSSSSVVVAGCCSQFSY